MAARCTEARDAGTVRGPYAEVARRGAAAGAIRDPIVAADVLEPIAAAEVQEVAVVMSLNVHGGFMSVREVARGAVEHVDISLPLAIRAVAKEGTYWAILAHNHPSGSAAPSAADARLWRDARAQFACAGLTLCDHLIIAMGEFYSFLWASRWRLHPRR